MNLRQANRAKCATNEKQTLVCVVQVDVVKRLQHHHRHLDLSPPAPLFDLCHVCCFIRSAVGRRRGGQARAAATESMGIGGHSFMRSNMCCWILVVLPELLERQMGVRMWKLHSSQLDCDHGWEQFGNCIVDQVTNDDIRHN